MIKILDDYTLGFIEFLNNKHFTDKEVKLNIMHDYLGYKTKNGKCYAMYVVERKTIYLATKVPEHLKDFKDYIIFNLAHEYKHFLQDVNNENVNNVEKAEEDANEFAKKVCYEYSGFDYSNIKITNL